MNGLPPRWMRWIYIAAAIAILFVLTACGSNPPKTVPVYVSVPVECRETVPDRPVMPTEEFTEKPALDAYVRAARAEIERREGYEGQLRTALEACTAPIK